MPNAIRIHQVGGPEVLQFESVSVGDPGAGRSARATHRDRLELYRHLSALRPLQDPAAVGSRQRGRRRHRGGRCRRHGPEGRTIASRTRAGAIGAYAEARVLPIDRLVKLPESVSDRVAATLMLKGLTVQYLLRQTYQVKAGETILLHAAAGGIGLIACQWARALGATVIGTVSSDAKAELAKANGCTHTIVYSRENFVERVKELTGGKGVPVVYDAVGKDTFPGSLDCLSAARTVRELRQFVGSASTLRDSAAVAKGIAVCHTTDAVHLYRQARRSAEDGRGNVCIGAIRQAQERRATDLRAEGCGSGASRSRSTQDDRIDGVAAVAA